MRRRFPVLRAFALVAAVGCVRLAQAQVAISEPWVRGTVEGQTSTVAYMKFKSDIGARLVSVTSPLAARVGVHEMTMDGNLMRMRAVDALQVPAGGALALEEGHRHLMLEGLKRPLKPGDTVPLTLRFVDSRGTTQTVEVQASVRALGASSSAPAN
jgi:periplasmic copper chaperone A